MSGTSGRIARRFSSFLRRDDGNVSVEFMLWLPLFVGLMLLSADVSLMFMRQSLFMEVSRDTARIVSRHGLDPEAAQEYARTHAAVGAYRPDVSVKVDPLDATVTVEIVGQSRALAPFGVLAQAIGDTVSTRVTQALEPI